MHQQWNVSRQRKQAVQSQLTCFLCNSLTHAMPVLPGTEQMPKPELIVILTDEVLSNRDMHK